MKNNKNSRPCVCVISFCPCQWDGEIQRMESDLDYESLDPEAIEPGSAEEFREMLAAAWGSDPEQLLTEPPEHVRAIHNGPDPRYLSVWSKRGDYCYQYLPAGWEANE